MPDTERPEKKDPDKREFMRAKIVKQPLSRRQVAKRLAIFLCLAVVFGAVAGVSFVLARPLADRYLGVHPSQENPSISFTMDEPETEATVPESEAAESEETDGNIAEAVSKAMADYTLSVESLEGLYGSVRDIGLQVDRGIVTVRSGKQHMDLFGNPVENTGDYAGVVIAKTSGEFLIFTYADAVRQADSVAVTFFDGTEAVGQSKQIDEVLDMAVVSVSMEGLPKEVRTSIGVLSLGNSYSVKAGDFVIGAGSPAGFVHSITYGTVSYVARNVQMIDGVTRILYADIHSNSETGTFLVNTAGELIGWTSEEYRTEDTQGISTVVSISDYKAVLEKMINGLPAPYFGVRGQEVNESMREADIPAGVYVMEAASGSPAYDAGIQNGDIIIRFGEKELTTFKELQMQIENSQSGIGIPVKVMRKGRDGYTELVYTVDIRAR